MLVATMMRRRDVLGPGVPGAAGGLVVLFKDGVFAWNGLLAFWMVAVFFGLWFLIMAWQLWVSVTASDGDSVAPAVSENEPARSRLQR